VCNVYAKAGVKRAPETDWNAVAVSE